MRILALVSLFPYLWIILGSLRSISMPSEEVFAVTLVSCLIYHALFLYSCRSIGYGLLTITYFFFWIFLGLAPFMCSLTGRWLWGNITYEMSSQIIRASLLSLLFITIFQIVHRLSFKRAIWFRLLTMAGKPSDFSLFSGLWLSLVTSVCVLVGLGIEGTFYRSANDTYLSTGIWPLFIQDFVRPMPLLAGIPIAWVLWRRPMAFAKPRTWFALLIIAIGLVTNFPLSVSRYYGWMIICLFFYYATLQIKPAWVRWLTGLLLIGGFFGSFVIDASRYARSLEDIKVNLVETTEASTDKFYVGHVDAFELLTYGVQYVEEKGATLGHQLLGVFLFWVPRTAWEDKPLATGQLLGSSFINILSSTENTNLSAPIVLEGYINFGIFGVISFAVIAGVLAGSMDRAIIWRRLQGVAQIDTVYLIDAVAAPFLGLWIYVLRGSLLATAAYTIGIISAGLFTWLVFFGFKKVRPRPPLPRNFA